MKAPITAVASGLALILAVFAPDAAPAQQEAEIVPYDRSQDPDILDLTIVHFNDLRHIEGFKGRGGLARVATVIEEERASKLRVLVTHGGNAVWPSLMSAFDNGAHMIDVLNHMGIDVMAMGSSELGFGPAVAEALIGTAEFPMVSTNLIDPAGERIAGTRETWTAEFGAFKIGVFSLMSPAAKTVTTLGRFEPQPPQETAEATAKQLRGAGADFVIALAELKEEEQVRLVRSGVVDLVLGAHQPILRTYYDGKTAFAQSRGEGTHLAIVDLTLQRVRKEYGGRGTRVGEGDQVQVTDIEPARIEVEVVPSFGFRVVDTQAVPNHEEIHEVVQRHLYQVSDELDKEAVTVPVRLDSRRPLIHRDDSSFGHAVADAARRATGAELALFNNGFMRAERLYEAGDVLTGRDLLTEFPTRPRILVLSVTGKDIVAALEHGVSNLEDDTLRFPAVSGMVVVVDRGKPPGERIESVTVEGGPLDPEARYKIAVTDFMAKGGVGYAMFAGQPRVIDEAFARPLVRAFVDYLNAPPDSLERDLAEDRMVFKGG